MGVRRCPCKVCTDKRHPGCHGECEDYITWKQEHDDFVGAKHESEKINQMWMDVHAKNIRRVKKK